MSQSKIFCVSVSVHAVFVQAAVSTPLKPWS